MLVWLRLLVTIIRSYFRKPINSSDELIKKTHSISFRIWPTECERTLLNYARYLTFMEASRADTMRRAGFFFLFLKKGWVAVAGAVYISYKRPLKRFQKFEVTSQLVYWDKKWFYFEHRLLRNGKLLTHALAKVIVVDKKSYISPATIFNTRNFQILPIEKPQSVDKLEEYERLMSGRNKKPSKACE